MTQKEIKAKIIDLMFKNFGNCPKKLPGQILELFEEEKQKWYQEGFDYAIKLRNFAAKKVTLNHKKDDERNLHR